MGFKTKGLRYHDRQRCWSRDNEIVLHFEGQQQAYRDYT